MFNSAEPGPLVSNLPADGRPIVPDVLLDGLEPTAVRIGHSRDDRYQPGKLSDGRPLAIRDYPFSHGFGTPGESEITFPLTSEYKRFVAVIGLCPQSIDVGPFEILFDGEPHWTSGAERFGRNSPAAQIDVPIPPGHKSITLRTLGREGYGAWAQAGFMRRP
jgi:hypothetical protein